MQPLLSPPGPRYGTIVSSKVRAAYDEQMAIAESSFERARGPVSDYWWALHTIWVGNLWRAKYEEHQKMSWIGEITAEPWGPSRGDFYGVMNAIERLQKLGQTEVEIRDKLGRLTTALKGDLARLFEKNGKGELRPDVAAKIEAGGEEPSGFVNRVFQLAPDQQRAAVGALTQLDRVYATSDWFYDPNQGRMLANVVWESEEHGIEMTGTLAITFTETTEPRRTTQPQGFMPYRFAQWLIDKLYLRKP